MARLIRINIPCKRKLEHKLFSIHYKIHKINIETFRTFSKSSRSAMSSRAGFAEFPTRRENTVGDRKLGGGPPCTKLTAMALPEM